MGPNTLITCTWKSFLNDVFFLKEHYNGDFTPMCGLMWCREPGKGSCRSMVPGDGTLCGNKKVSLFLLVFVINFWIWIFLNGKEKNNPLSEQPIGKLWKQRWYRYSKHISTWPLTSCLGTFKMIKTKYQSVVKIPKSKRNIIV